MNTCSATVGVDSQFMEYLEDNRIATARNPNSRPKYLREKWTQRKAQICVGVILSQSVSGWHLGSAKPLAAERSERFSVSFVVERVSSRSQELHSQKPTTERSSSPPPRYNQGREPQRGLTTILIHVALVKQTNLQGYV